MTQIVQTSDFDNLTADEATEALLRCARIPRWADDLVAGRPYVSRGAVLLAARQASLEWTWDEVELALTVHPRIGERPAALDAESSMSRREQTGIVGGLTRDLGEQLRAVNLAYEARFGRVLLVRAAGRTPWEVLDEARHRLGLDEQSDQAATTEQLRQIALLRLEGLLAT